VTAFVPISSSRCPETDDLRVPRKSVSESPVRIPLMSLAAEPAFDVLQGIWAWLPRSRHLDTPVVSRCGGGRPWCSTDDVVA
jgi:hypothetical protein